MSGPRIFTRFNAIRHPPAHAVVTVGVFDGVHEAHQRILRTTVRLAKRFHATSVAVTFHPDPRQVLDPAHPHPTLMPVDARVALLQALGIEWVWVIPFTKTFAHITAERFINEVLIQRLHTVAIVVGEGFLFGWHRRGDMQTLHRLGPLHGMRIVSVKHVTRGRVPISSSRIRQCIATGQLAQARDLLGRSPILYGTVVRGAGRGRHLGFPTANIQLLSQVLPPPGVYAVVVRRRSDDRIWNGVMNLGVRPTFGRGPLVCEVHLFGFSGSLRGQSVSVALISRLRHERCFPSKERLVQQIRRDTIRARRLLRRVAGNHISPQLISI